MMGDLAMLYPPRSHVARSADAKDLAAIRAPDMTLAIWERVSAPAVGSLDTVTRHDAPVRTSGTAIVDHGCAAVTMT